MVIRISQDMYLVYFFGGKSLVQAIIMVVTQAKKNISNFIPGTASFIKGNSPIVAPPIINTSKVKARMRFFFDSPGTLSLPLATIKNTRDSPQVGINWSSAQRMRVSPSRICTSLRSPLTG